MIARMTFAKGLTARDGIRVRTKELFHSFGKREEVVRRMVIASCFIVLEKERKLLEGW